MILHIILVNFCSKFGLDIGITFENVSNAAVSVSNMVFHLWNSLS